MASVTEINRYEPKRKNAPPPPPPGPDHARDDWKTFLRINKAGDFRGDVLNISLALKFAPEWSGLLGWDEAWLAPAALLQPPFSTKKQPPFLWSEEHNTLLAAWMLHQGFATIGERVLQRAVKAVAMGHGFHRVRQYLRSLLWDRQSRIDTWLATFLRVRDSPYTRAVGKNFLIAAVARAMQPGCKVDDVLILEGKQGLRKSMALEALAGSANFANNLAAFGTRDARDQSHGIWIIEVQEFDRVLRGAGASKAKEHMSTKVDYYRGAFKRDKGLVERDSIICGSTNQDQYLVDETGNRRYWPVRCEFADVEGIAAARDQLWAEAVARFDAGEQWHLTAAESDLASVEQNARLESHPWEEIVLPFMDGKKSVSLAEIFDVGGPLQGKERSSNAEMIVVKILRSEGWAQRRPAAKKTGPRPLRRYYAPDS